MSFAARKLIAENKKNRATFLDLGNCGLTEIPEEIGELVWLESLSLTREWWKWNGSAWKKKKTRNDLSKISNLFDLGPSNAAKKLTLLDIKNVQVANLSPLTGLSRLHALYVSDTLVTDLSPLADLSGLQTLNISDTQVADLSPLTGLSRLHELYVSNTQITDLSPLAGLSRLQTLDISKTNIADLAPLSGLTDLQTLFASKTTVADLSPLTWLSKLQVLYVSNTQVTELSALAGLSGLKMLDVWNTQVANLSPLANLIGLQMLDVSNTNTADLAPLSGLTDLQTLFASNTKVADLSALAGLAGLQKLDVSNTKVVDLSPLSTRSDWSRINFSGCPLIIPPLEIASQGNDAILNYFLERMSGEIDHLYEAKMLILGEGEAGKTSLLRRLYQPTLPLPTRDESTKGIAIHQQEFLLKNERTFRLNVWDFGGQQIYHATHQFFLTRRSLYLLVDDTRSSHKSVSDEGFKYWLDLINVFGGDSPVLIFQNEKGGRSKAIDLPGIRGRYANVVARYSGDLRDAKAADAIREAIEYQASHLGHIGEELPARWIQVRVDIEKRARETPHITLQEYYEIYARYLEPDRSKALHLSQYFHDLGVFLHFQDDPLLVRTVILQNAWATEAVFRVLDDEVVKKKFGRFTGADCERLWSGSMYDGMHLELLTLMQRFELCYRLLDSDPPTWLATQLLPPSKPPELGIRRETEDLLLRYRYDFLPMGIVNRLAVRLHRFVRHPERAWVTGVLFERDRTSVLVELLPNGAEIELRSHGPERAALLNVVAADLEKLNESFQGLRDKVDKLVPCNCSACRLADVPEFFAYKRLLKRKQDHKLRVECPNSYEYIDVLALLDGIHVDRLVGWEKVSEIKIFLASSSELWEDRDAFELYLRQQNDQIEKEGVYLRIVRWENFLDAMSETRMQDEYNKEVRDCDVFVSLFFTKAGNYTVEEFNVAHAQFQDTGRPLIYTFFKNANVRMQSIGTEVITLLDFKNELAELGHFYTEYDDIEHLKLKFRDQLDFLLSRLHANGSSASSVARLA